MAGSAFSADHYYEKIASIQQSMHEREKRRLELERELFAYSLSDKRISQIKCAKLRSYLKEICEREKRAKMRNLELLRDVECIEMSMKEHGPDHGPLLQQKAECLNRISKFLKMREEDFKENTIDSSCTQSLTSQHPHTVSAAQLPPARLFMDRLSSGEPASTSVSLRQASQRLPDRCSRSPERVPSGLLKDFRAAGEAASVATADGGSGRLSDDISGSNDSPDGCGLSEEHERAVACAGSQTAADGDVPSGGEDEHADCPPVTLRRPEHNAVCPSGEGAVQDKSGPEEHADYRGNVQQCPITEMAERGAGKTTSVSLSESSSSNLSISLTESEPEEDESEATAHPGATSGARAGSSDSHSLHSERPPVCSGGSSNRPQQPAPSEKTTERLSCKGLFYLLESIEGRLHTEQTSVYRESSIDRRKLNHIISLCNRGSGLNDEDLEACAAVVLRELQRLSWSTATGCLLPQDLVSAHHSLKRPENVSSSLPPDAARLWDRWFKHALLLKEKHILSTEGLLHVFTPLLLERHATYGHQAKVLLRTLLARSSEECPSDEDCDLSSLHGPPSIADHVTPARPAQDHAVAELQSAEEGSQDQSPVENIPIRETKAYQLLKQSATQKRLESSGEEEEENNKLPGTRDGHEEDPGRAKRFSHQDPCPQKEKQETKPFFAVQSKAFWGESDDSDSEIEAALRPPAFSSDDFDD